MLRVTIWDHAFEPLAPIETTFVSYVNDESYGIPPLMGPAREGQTRATEGQSVLYLNLSKTTAHHIERISA